MQRSRQAVHLGDLPERKEKMHDHRRRLDKETEMLEEVIKSSGESLSVDGRAFRGQMDELEAVLDKLEEHVDEEEKTLNSLEGQLSKIRTDISRPTAVARRMEATQLERNDWEGLRKAIEYNMNWADEMANWINFEGWRLRLGLQWGGINPTSEVTTVLWEVRTVLHSLRSVAPVWLKEGNAFGEKLLETEGMIERMIPKLKKLLDKEKKELRTAKLDESLPLAPTASPASDPRPATPFARSFLSSCSSMTACSQASFPECELLEGFQTKKPDAEQEKTTATE